MIKAVFFDFDGVLTIEATGTTSIVNYISAETGIDREQFNREYWKYSADLLLGKVTHEQIWGSICEALNREIPYQVLVDSFINTALNPEVVSLARRIKSNGYKVGLITDNKADRMDVISKKHGFDGLFDVICVSAALGFSKTGEEIFWEAVRRAGVKPSESVFIDNTPENLIIPRKMGMHVIHFDNDKRDHEKLITQLEEAGVKTS